MNKNRLNILTFGILFLIPTLILGQAVAPDLKTASSFALFTAAGAFNNTGASTKVTDNVGNNTGAFNAFPLGTLMGLKIRGSEAAEAAQAAQAAMDVASAYAEITLKNACDETRSTILGMNPPNMPQELTPKSYCLNAASLLDGELILDGGGDPNAVFIFRINGAFASTVDSKITLRNGASACNVYWQINGAVSLAARTVFQGTILANGAIELFDNVNLLGRGLSTAGAISTADNVVVTAGMAPIASNIIAASAVVFCEGESVVLDGNMGGTWSNGAVGTMPISVTVTMITTLYITGGSLLCPGKTTQLCAPVGFVSYLWDTGETTTCITAAPSVSKTYTVTVGGCGTTATHDIRVILPNTCDCQCRWDINV